MKNEQISTVRLHDILPLLPGGGRTFLCHGESDTAILPENLRELTDAGREDFAALLDARVTKIVPSDESVEMILTDVEPEELVRFNQEYEAHQEAELAMGDAPTKTVKPEPPADWTSIQYPILRGHRALTVADLDVQERIGGEAGRIDFCLDVLADEETVFGRQLSSEKDESYIQAYTSYLEDAGQVDDTLDIVVRSPGGDEWFSCALTEETRESLKWKMDAFCVEMYGERLPGPSEQRQDEAASVQMGPAM